MQLYTNYDKIGFGFTQLDMLIPMLCFLTPF